MSTPMETNTEELREILQQVYDLPNAGGGSGEPDLVINLNMGSAKYSYLDITKEEFSFTGDLPTVKEKIQNQKNVIIAMKYVYYYGSTEFVGTATPFQFGHSSFDNYTYADFILACIPGSGSDRRIFAIKITDTGEMDVAITAPINAQ